MASSKNRLQEYCQRNSDALPAYQTHRVGGADHEPLFQSSVTFLGVVYDGELRASKIDAEKSAAEAALLQSGCFPDLDVPVRAQQGSFAQPATAAAAARSPLRPAATAALAGLAPSVASPLGSLGAVFGGAPPAAAPATWSAPAAPATAIVASGLVASADPAPPATAGRALVLFDPVHGNVGHELLIDADHCADALNVLVDHGRHSPYDKVTVFCQKSANLPKSAGRFNVKRALSDAPEATDAYIAYYCFRERMDDWHAQGTRVTFLSKDQVFERFAEILNSVNIPSSRIARLELAHSVPQPSGSYAASAQPSAQSLSTWTATTAGGSQAPAVSSAGAVAGPVADAGAAGLEQVATGSAASKKRPADRGDAGEEDADGASEGSPTRPRLE